MLYECERCGKVFNHKTHYNIHLRRKYLCKINIKICKDDKINVNEIKERDDRDDKMERSLISQKDDLLISIDKYFTNETKELSEKNINKDVLEDVKKYKCNICEKRYKHAQSLYNHKKKHKSEINKDDVQKDETNDIKNELEELKQLFIKQQEELEYLKRNNTINNITNNITNTQNINTINIVQFGRENIGLLSEEEIKDILYGAGVDPLLASIEYTHFNERLPEQQNIKYTNINSKYVDIHNGKTWLKQPLNNVINDLLDSHTSNLTDILETCKSKHRVKKTIKGIIEDYRIYNYLDSDDIKLRSNKKIINKINTHKDDVKLLIHNKTKNKSNILVMDV